MAVRPVFAMYLPYTAPGPLIRVHGGARVNRRILFHLFKESAMQIPDEPPKGGLKQFETKDKNAVEKEALSHRRFAPGG